MLEAVTLLRLALVAALIAVGVVGYRRTRNVGFLLLPAVIVGWPFVQRLVFWPLTIRAMEHSSRAQALGTVMGIGSLLQFALLTLALYLLSRRQLRRRG